MKLTDFKALTFDCYGTLIDWEKGILAALSAWRRRSALALDDQELLGLFAQAESRAQVRHPASLYSVLLAMGLESMAGDLGSPASAAECEAFGRSVKDWPAFPDSAAALRYLKRHYKLVIVSNIDRASFRHSNDKLGIEFDHVVTAEDVGSYKPALGHFHAALAWLAASGVPKAKVLHTAQSLYHDHVPAKHLGLASIWINRQGGRPGATRRPDTPVKPDWEVPSMAAMVELHERQAD
jgi:2-haloalkanoic acid dehalogenase type II